MRARHSIYLAYLHTLAFTLLTIGSILLIDSPRLTSRPLDAAALVPSGAPLAILVGLTLLLITSRKRRAAQLFAGLLIAIALFGLVNYAPDGASLSGAVPLPGFSPIPYSLSLVLILVAITTLSDGTGPRGRVWGRLIGFSIAVIGGLSLLSTLPQPAFLTSMPGVQAYLNMIGLGVGPEKTLNTSVLVTLLGIGVVLLHTAPDPSPQKLDRATLLAGLMGTIITCLGWHLMHQHNVETTLSRSELLLSSAQHMIKQQRETKIELIHRIAERWAALDQLPLGAFWRQEAESHLRDFTNLKLIGVLDDQLRPTAMVARDLERRTWLHRFLAAPERQGWLHHVIHHEEAHMSHGMTLGTETLAALIAAPLHLPGRGDWLIVASVDIEALIAPHVNTGQTNLIVRVFEDEQILFESELARHSLVPVGDVTAEYHHDQSWRIATYLDPRGDLMKAAFLPPLTLLFGLGLTFLLMVSQRLGWLSRERSRRLDEANLGLSTSLTQQSRLRATNGRIMQYSRDMLCSFDKLGYCTQMSPACREVLGYEPDELIGEPFRKHILPEDYAETRSATAEVMQGGRAINFRNRYVRKDGSIAHIMWSAGWAEEEQELFCVGRDITLLVDAEKLLTESEQRYRSLFTFNPDPVYSLDLEGRFQSMNQAGLALLGYAEDELIGKGFPFLLHPGERPKVSDHFTLALEGQPQRYETQCQSQGGDLFDLDITNLPIMINGQVVGIFGIAKDVTTRKRMTQAIRERDQFFTLSLDMFCTVSFTGRFVQVNPAFTRVLGFAANELTNRPYMDLVIKEDRAKVLQTVDKLRDGHQVHNLEIQVLDRAGVPHWLEMSATAGDDNIIYCAARDVTQRRLTEDKLRESETMLAFAGNMARMGAWAIQLPERHLIWSDEVRAIHGLGPGSSPSVEDALGFYAPESREKIATLLENCVRQGVPYDEEFQIITADDRRIWVRTIAQALRDHSGAIIRVQGALQDITSEKLAAEKVRQSAERLAATLESITDAFFTLDWSWRFTYVNAESERLLERTRGELLGKTIWDVFKDAVGSTFDLKYRQAMEESSSVKFEEYYSPLGRWFDVSAYPSSEGLTVYFRDVSERKKADGKLRETLEELARSNQELENFAFVASHDLQEPLRKIQAFGERLGNRAEDLDDQSRDYLQRMNSAARRMQTLIRDLLSYSRISTHKQPFVTLDLNQILTEVLSDLEAALKDSGANVTCEPLPSIQGDPTQVRQVFQNLLSNAVKFRQADVPPRIRVYAENESLLSWTLCISDNGIGFDEKYLDRIFDPFQRLHSRQAYPGTGIGLAIVAKILKRHDAMITAASTPGAGTTFRIGFCKKSSLRGTAE